MIWDVLFTSDYSAMAPSTATVAVLISVLVSRPPGDLTVLRGYSVVGIGARSFPKQGCFGAFNRVIMLAPTVPGGVPGA